MPAHGACLRNLVGLAKPLTSINADVQAKSAGEKRACVVPRTRPYSPTACLSGIAASDHLQASRKTARAVPVPAGSERSPAASSAGQEAAGSEEDSEEAHDTRETTCTLEEGAEDAGGLVFAP